MRETCDGCPLEGRLLCLHTPRDAFDFAFLAISFFIPFLAGKAIGGLWLGFALWVVLAFIFFVYVEALVLCRHRPYYAEEGFTLRWHANFGLPKIPRFNPRPLSQVEKILFLGYGAVLGLFYVPFFVLSQQWLLLAITTWAVITWPGHCSALGAHNAITSPARSIAYQRTCERGSSTTIPPFPRPAWSASHEWR